MFSRIVKYLVFLLILVGAGIWLAEHPGTLSVEWLGVIVELPLAFAFIAVLIVIGICAGLYRFYVFLRRSPQIFGHYRAEKRTHQGYDALTKGLVAVAAGDQAEAAKFAKKAENLLQEPGLTLLLSAQSAQLAGDETAAQRFFQTMSEQRGEIAFLGLRGLLNQALAQGNKSDALELAERAQKIKPQAKWLLPIVLEMQLAKKQWAKAQNSLDAALKAKVIDGAQAQKQKAALMVERARDAANEGQLDAAIKLLRQSLKLEPSFLAAALDLAALLEKKGQPKKALPVLEELWIRQPSAEVYAFYQQVHSESDALKRVRLAEKLAARNRNHVESRIAIAQAALEGQLWGEARDELEILVKEAPSARVFALMAELVETENGDMVGAREWLRRATQAAANPAWVCETCGDVSAYWSAVCGKCDGFVTKEWQTPYQPHKKGELVPYKEDEGQATA